MFKPPKYSTLLDPKQIPEGYLRKLFDPCKVTEHDFFLAVSEAHRRYQRAWDEWFRLLLKWRQRHDRRTKWPGQEKLEKEMDIAADGVLWLIGGLLGRYDEMSNAQALGRMQEYLKVSRKRARREQRKTLKSDLPQAPFRKGKK